MINEEENVFGWIGLRDKGNHYVAAVGLYDYYWSLKDETRAKVLAGWIQALEVFQDPEFAKKLTTRQDEDGEVLYVAQSTNSIEDKGSENVIQFPNMFRPKP